ncbi:MAG: hypothetical protein QY321_01800 [Patescibacteria group bacterium]|nr:MAG: hypothetical protein QY321_01800 [Patescibacteria group bacterium]
MKLKLLFSLLGLALLTSGCTLSFGGGPSGPDGGIFRSINKGLAWNQASVVPTASGQPASLVQFDANFIVMDPGDHNTLYYGAKDNGLFVSYDNAQSWTPLRATSANNISNLVVDPVWRCTLYAASVNRLTKSVDCGRSWEQVYYDNDPSVGVTALAIDHFDNQILYIGTTRGEVIISNDAGKSWRTSERFNNQISKIAVSPSDSRLVFAATVGQGIYRSNNKGVSWDSLDEALSEFPNHRQFRDIYISKNYPGHVLLANNYGLLLSTDYGDTWQSLRLITPENNAMIYSAIISEHSDKEIFYVTGTTFYSTVDGGSNWSTRKLPSARAGWQILEHPDQPGLLYMTVREQK